MVHRSPAPKTAVVTLLFFCVVVFVFSVDKFSIHQFVIKVP